jgi:hypothetical protein
MKNPKTLHETIEAAMGAEAAETNIETTQRWTFRLNVIEEDSDFSEAAEEVTVSRRLDEQERPTRGQCPCDATRIYEPVWHESVRVGRHLTWTSMPYIG